MKLDKITIICLALTLIFGGSISFAQEPAGSGPMGTIRLPEPPADTEPREGAVPIETISAVDNLPEAAKPKEEMIYLNVQDQDIKDVIRQISKATSKNFIIDDKIRGKITILSERMMTKEEAYQAFLSALEVAGYTVVTGPAGIIKVVSLKDAISSPIPIHVDSTPYTDSFVTRLISLQNISAVDMSNAIKPLISKDGNLFAYPATNTIIITDSGTNIDRLMKIIKELDQEGPQQVIEIVPIKYAEAEQIATTVLSLFEAEQQRTATTTRRTTRGAAAATSSEEGLQDLSKIIADTRTNSVIVVASKRSIQKIRSIIARLDTFTGDDTGTIHVHYLKYANAEEMAATLSAVTANAGAGAGAVVKPAGKTQTTTSPTVAQFEGGMSIGADKTTNALIITASAKDYQMLVDGLISKLDVPRRQVYLESIVMELTIRRGGDYGLSGFSGGGNNTLLGFGQTFGAAGQLFEPMSLFTSGGLLGGVIGRDTVTINVPTTSGTTQEVTIPAFAAFLNLVSTYTNANIVSTPNILTLDNEEALIDIKQKTYAESTTITGGATGAVTTTPVPLEAGLSLKITPQISEGDAVRLQIEHELSNFTGTPTVSGATPSRSRKINTTVMAMDGQTVVLGGLMEDVETKSKRKIPILGDIPILGLLFQQTTLSKDKSNLLVFITPYVIKDPTDFSKVLERKITQRNRFIDENYGKRAQRSIRDMIAGHRADLLEYTPPPISEPEPTMVETTTEEAAGTAGTVETAEGATEGAEEAVTTTKPEPLKAKGKEVTIAKPVTPPPPPPPKIEGLDLAY
ncbi:MAG: type II secretion system secretin GspD [Pseudomonadota bacterium]